MDPAQLFPWLFGGSMILTIVLVVISSICALVIPAVVIGGVVYLIAKRGQQARATNQASLSWLSTQGRVLKSRVEVSGGDYVSVTPRVYYEYEVGGVSYQGDRIRAGDIYMRFSRRGGQEDAYKVVDRYPEGAEVTVYYNPENPAESALEH